VSIGAVPGDSSRRFRRTQKRAAWAMAKDACAVSAGVANPQPTVEGCSDPHARLGNGGLIFTGVVARKIQRTAMTDDIKTPSQIADEARQTGQNAANAAGQLANEAQANAASTVQALRPAMDDAKATGRDALNTAKALAGDAKAVAGDAWNTARSYAKNAGGVAGEKLGDFKAKASDFQETTARRIADEPLKAVAIGVAAGALLAALVMRRGRDRRDY